MTDYRSFPAGEEAAGLTPGDFILCHRKGAVSACIRAGQRIRFRGDQSKYAYWSHAGLVVSFSGDLVEALTRGVARSHISKYKHVEYTLVRTATNVQDRSQILRFADFVVGEGYGFLTLVCILFGMLTGGRLTFGFNGTCICSGLVARAQERSGAVFDREPQEITPADLARYYDVCAPDHAVAL